MNGEKVISVNHICKSYKLYDRPSDRLREAWSFSQKKSYHKDHFALNDINFDVYKGECIGILGKNGSGKSTLLKIITGVANPVSGSVEVKGRISALLELGTGFNMEYTGMKNIYLNGTMMGYTKQEMNERVKDIVDFAEIGDFIYQPVKTYSSGMFARLAFAVAINVDPDILIVDEALSVGDIFFQSKCYKKFNEFQERGKTILFVSHDLSSILKYCSRCLLIDRGSQIAVGKTPDIVNAYRKILTQANVVNVNEKGEAIEENGKESGEILDIDNMKEGEIWQERLTLNPNCVEYGDGKVSIVDFAVADGAGNISSSVYKGQEYSIRIKVRFHEDVSEPIFAYTVKDLKGVELTGTNTMLEENNLTHVAAGEVVTVEFKQRMVLQGGQYLLSIACTGYDAGLFVVHHRLYDVCNLQVISARNTIGFFDNESEVCYL